MKRLVLALSVALLLAGCGRRVVLDPHDAARANDKAWKVSSTPH